MSEKQMRLGALEAGGTKMVCAVVSGDGEVLDRMETPTLTPAETVPQMVEWFTARDVDALGIGAFGPTCVDPNDEHYGSILQTPKLAWRGYGLRAAFADALGIPVTYDTDVNVACLGEVVFGCENMGWPSEKIACASVTMYDSEVMVLDEPTLDMDVRSIRMLADIIRGWKKSGKTVLVAEHRLHYLATIADRVIYIEDGQIAADMPAREFFRKLRERSSRWACAPSHRLILTG